VPRPDFAIYHEPTALDIYPAQMGFFICDITVKGRTAYFGVPEEGVDALKATHAILSELWAHSQAIEAEAPHPLVGPSFLLATSIEGGGYIAVPGACRLSLIRKLRPGESLEAARTSFEAAARSAPLQPGIEVGFAYPAGRDHPLGGTAAEVASADPSV
jgi:acetylornithine deacetylase